MGNPKGWIMNRGRTAVEEVQGKRRVYIVLCVSVNSLKKLEMKGDII